MRSSLGFVGLLLAIWLLAWGSVSWANVASGLAVALVLLVAIPGPRRRAHLPVVRPVALARLGVRLARDVVVSNAVLAREVLAPRPRLAPGVVRVSLPECSDEVLAVVAALINMTPGTIPVEVGRDPAELVVHVLHLSSVEEVRRDVRSLAGLVVGAFGGREVAVS